jgi:lipopolysaccharide transport system ATP-binding protein
MDLDIALSASHLTKTYKLYDKHSDRVKETFHPLRKQYHRPFNALNDVSFYVRKGETLGIIGRNGSGKSTLLQIVCGVLQPTSGGLAVEGRLSALLELGAGFNQEFTGIENVYLNGSIMGFTKKEMDEKLDDILAFADIGDFVHQPVKTYSSGMGVRLAFSIYSVIDPDIFIVDEALAVGDAYFVHKCMLRFHDMQEQGKTIIFVSHDPSSIKKLCHRALWLDTGELKMIGDSSEVVDAYLAHVFRQPVSIVTNRAQKQEPSNNSSQDMAAEAANRLSPENTIPNIDRRIGDQSLSFLGVALYDEAMKPLSVSSNNTSVVLRMTFQNNSLEEKLPLAVGYIFKDSRGIEIASTHSRIEGVFIPPLEIGESLTVRMKIALPVLYPGSYSFSPSLSYVKNGEHTVCDRLINAIVFEITSTCEIHVLLKFDTEVEIERQ